MRSTRIELGLRGDLGRSIFALRWIMAPIYLGLFGALLLVAVKFLQKLAAAVPVLLAQSSGDTIFTALSLIDMSLVANLLVIVLFAGWENFIGRLHTEGDTARPAWLTGLDFGAVKLKLIGSVVAIGAITVLESLVRIDSTPSVEVAWELAVLLALGVTGVLLALMDRLSGGG